MADLNPMQFVTLDDGYAQIDYPGILAGMTGTRDGEWEDVDGPDSGVGIDYWYVHAAGKLEAYINVDQSRVSISVTEADGGEIEALEFDIEETEDAA